MPLQMTSASIFWAYAPVLNVQYLNWQLGRRIWRCFRAARQQWARTGKSSGLLLKVSHKRPQITADFIGFKSNQAHFNCYSRRIHRRRRTWCNKWADSSDGGGRRIQIWFLKLPTVFHWNDIPVKQTRALAEGSTKFPSLLPASGEITPLHCTDLRDGRLCISINKHTPTHGRTLPEPDIWGIRERVLSFQS